uniref:Inactive serine protease 54 n=1 Tax=Jaculus jaculus TaxID=51337 RepID=A0A8C5KPU6_JACJA|nr:inactive serine protease 54 [Jaculus jaculus]
MAVMAWLLLLLSVSHSSSTNCGIQKANLVDQSEENLVGIEEFPWVVSVQDVLYTHLAFGCILSEYWILSIASAFQNRTNAIVVVGIANMDPRKIVHTEYPVSTIILHEDFDNYSMRNNIALLQTDSAISFDNLVQPICFLGTKLDTPPVLKNCWVSGWNPTSATGNYMTMSILRRISVKDVELCPLRKLRKTGCGSHTEQETDSVCLGEPGSPVMCQLQQLDLWVLRGIVTYGGDICPGLFLYTKVEDFSDWIMSQAKTAGPGLTSLHPWEKLVPVPYDESHTTVTQTMYSELGHVEQPQSYSQEQRRSTGNPWTEDSSKDGRDFRVKGLQESDGPEDMSIPPMYYDYYGGEVGAGRTMAGQNRLHWPQERVLGSLVLVFLSAV